MKSFPDLRQGSLARRYFLTIGGAVCLVLLLAIGIEIPQAYRATLERVGEVQAADLHSAAARVDEYLHAVEESLRDSAAVPWLRPPFTPEDVRVELHRLMKVVPALDLVIVAAADGTTRVSVSRLDLDNDPEASIEASLLKTAAERGFAIGPMQFKGGIEPVVTMVTRGSAASGGFIAARLNMRNVSDIVSGLRVGKAGEAFLVEGSDRIVAHRDSARTMQRLSDAGREQIAALRSRLTGEPPLAPPAQTVNSDGVPVLASAIALPRLGWMIIAQEPLEAALAPVRATVIRLMAIMGSGVLVAIALGVMMARRLTKPIVLLREGARRIAKGDLESRICAPTGDEIEELATDFNRMAEQLQDYTTGLERKVDEKTAALRDALGLANDAMRARAVFLAAASHDLRQPLYAISILSDALAGAALPPEARAILDKQRQAIAVLRTLFDNLLDLSRLDAGEVRPNLRTVSLREALGPLADEYHALATSRGLEWRDDIADAWVQADAELLHRVAANLLSNAVRYTERGHVALTARVEGGRALVEVADTGIGIAPQDQARVFEEFVQLQNEARDRERGVGLGLSIVRKIGLLLDMRIELASTPGKGTRVTFGIPVAEAAPVEREAAAVDAPAGEIAGKRVWIVEDDAMVRDALGVQFDAWGVDHDFALTRGELAALHDADGGWPDAAMLDDMLGREEGGLELARWLATKMEAARLAIVTGNVQPERLAALEASGIRILRKPLSSAQVAAWLRSATAGEAPRPAPTAAREG